MRSSSPFDYNLERYPVMSSQYSLSWISHDNISIFPKRIISECLLATPWPPHVTVHILSVHCIIFPNLSTLLADLWLYKREKLQIFGGKAGESTNTMYIFQIQISQWRGRLKKSLFPGNYLICDSQNLSPSQAPFHIFAHIFLIIISC